MFNSCATIATPGLGNQTLDAVETTKSDKRSEPSVYFLPGGWIGVEKTRASCKCSLDKRESLTSVIICTCGQLECFFSGCLTMCDIYFKNNDEVSHPQGLHLGHRVVGASVASSAALTPATRLEVALC